jgi:hypothetical protein
MGLFGGGVQVALRLDRERVVAGETVQARVEIGEPDRKTQGGRVELLYRNTYRYESRDSDGDRTNSRTTEDVVVVSEPLFEHATPAAGHVTVALPVPADAPGSDAKAVEWQVRAVVDRKRSRDARETLPLHVGSSPEALAAWAQAPFAAPDKGCTMTLEASSRVVRPGERITGVLTVRAPLSEPLSARALRVDLRRIRHDEDDLTDEDRMKLEVVAGGIELSGGEERRVPFEVVVPPHAGPSFVARHNTQRWYLEGIVDRPRARDYVGELEIVVLG